MPPHPPSLTVCVVQDLNHRQLVCFFSLHFSSSTCAAADIQFPLKKKEKRQTTQRDVCFEPGLYDELAVLGEGSGWRKELGTIKLTILSFICLPSNWAPPSVEAYKLSSGCMERTWGRGEEGSKSSNLTHKYISEYVCCGGGGLCCSVYVYLHCGRAH